MRKHEAVPHPPGPPDRASPSMFLPPTARSNAKRTCAREVDIAPSGGDKIAHSLMRLVLCWSHISGYITACWRALAAMPGVELKIIAFESGGEAFSTDLVRGLDCRLLKREEQDDIELVARVVKERDPELFYVTGWFIKPYRELITNPDF